MEQMDCRLQTDLYTLALYPLALYTLALVPSSSVEQMEQMDCRLQTDLYTLALYTLALVPSSSCTLYFCRAVGADGMQIADGLVHFSSVPSSSVHSSSCTL